jgi:uncharacterized membrane protein YdjX (TVP38/TMEM64 family)
MEKDRKDRLLKFVLGALLLLLFLLSYRYGSRKEEILDVLRGIDGIGILAPLLFITIQASRPFTFLPGALLTISGGILFGLGEGTLYSLLGTTAGACLAFWFSSMSMGEPLRKKGDMLFEKAPVIKKCTSKFGAVFLSRLLPFVPYNLVNYAAPALRIRLLYFSLATFAGLLPKMILYSSVGSLLRTV